MARPIEEPKVVEEDSPSGSSRSVTTHPAFGQISASRISGGTHLYGSEFQHQHYIRLRISHSHEYRDLSESSHYSSMRGDVVEVDMSEAQWATFVSSISVGMGTPCTLLSIGDRDIPGLPRPKVARDTFKGEAKRSTEKAQEHLDKLGELITASKLSAREKAAMLGQLEYAARGLTSSVQFVLDQFAEHMEKVVEKARTEITATAHAVLVKTGLSKLMGDKPKVLGISLDKRDHDGE